MPFGGWPAGLSFLLLAVATASCAIVGVVHARRGHYDRHRRWMLRSYVLICSAVALRLISGTAGLVAVPNAEAAYVVAAWSSWLLPLAAYEIVERLGIGILRDVKQWSVMNPSPGLAERTQRQQVTPSQPAAGLASHRLKS